MSTFEVYPGGVVDGDEEVSVRLMRSQVEALTVAAESAMARYGRKVGADPAYNVGRLNTLHSGYQRLRTASGN